VDISHVVWSEDGRVGLYFVELGASPRVPHVIYDRAASAFAAMTPSDLHPDVLADADILHVTGITPALSESCRQTQEALVDMARRQGVAVSFDVNYRARLGSPAAARAAAESVMPWAGFLFVNRADAETVLGVSGEAEAQVRQLGSRFPRATVVLTCGADGALAWKDGLHRCAAVPGEVVDRIGRGDAFCAGYLFGQELGGPELGLSCGTALASLAQTFSGDVPWITREDLLTVAQQGTEPRYR
jgi:2-dehydro-3-deoxygluconokinase